MHSFARHTLLLMVEQRACSGSPSTDKRLARQCSSLGLTDGHQNLSDTPSDFDIFHGSSSIYRPTRTLSKWTFSKVSDVRADPWTPWRSALCCESTCEHRARLVTFWHRDANATSGSRDAIFHDLFVWEEKKLRYRVESTLNGQMNR